MISNLVHLNEQMIVDKYWSGLYPLKKFIMVND
jgi:hypothetical protein